MTNKLIIILFSLAAIGGTRVNLDEKASIVFPETPKKKEAGGQVFYTATTREYVYYAALADIHPDVSSANEDVIRTRTYQNYIQGILTNAGIERLLEEKNFQVTRHDGKQITYLKNFGNRTNVKVICRIVLIGARMYQFEVWGLAGEVEKKAFLKFFNSVEISD
jgi:hypothetical protein